MLNQTYFAHTKSLAHFSATTVTALLNDAVTDTAQSDVTANGRAVTIKYWHFALCYFSKHCHSTTIRLNSTRFILHFHLDSEPMQAAHDSTVRPLQNVSTHLQSVHVLKRTRQSWTLAKWTYVMDLKISIEVNSIKSITRYTTLAASHVNGKTIHCYCGQNSSAELTQV